MEGAARKREEEEGVGGGCRTAVTVRCEEGLLSPASGTCGDEEHVLVRWDDSSKDDVGTRRGCGTRRSRGGKDVPAGPGALSACPALDAQHRALCGCRASLAAGSKGCGGTAPRCCPRQGTRLRRAPRWCAGLRRRLWGLSPPWAQWWLLAAP